MKRHFIWTAASIAAATLAVTAFAGTSIGAEHAAAPNTSDAAQRRTPPSPARRARSRRSRPRHRPPRPRVPAGTDGDTSALEIAVLSPDYAAQPAAKEAIDSFEAAAEAMATPMTVVDTTVTTRPSTARSPQRSRRAWTPSSTAFGTPQEFGEGLAAAGDAGIPVFGLDTGGVVEPTLVNVTTDNTFLGEASAQAIIDAMGGEGAGRDDLTSTPSSPCACAPRQPGRCSRPPASRSSSTSRATRRTRRASPSRPSLRLADQAPRRASSTPSGPAGTRPRSAPTRPPRRPVAPRSS